MQAHSHQVDTEGLSLEGAGLPVAPDMVSQNSPVRNWGKNLLEGGRSRW